MAIVIVSAAASALFAVRQCATFGLSGAIAVDAKVVGSNIGDDPTAGL